MLFFHKGNAFYNNKINEIKKSLSELAHILHKTNSSYDSPRENKLGKEMHKFEPM